MKNNTAIKKTFSKRKLYSNNNQNNFEDSPVPLPLDVAHVSVILLGQSLVTERKLWTSASNVIVTLFRFYYNLTLKKISSYYHLIN